MCLHYVFDCLPLKLVNRSYPKILNCFVTVSFSPHVGSTVPKTSLITPTWTRKDALHLTLHEQHLMQLVLQHQIPHKNCMPICNLNFKFMWRSFVLKWKFSLIWLQYHCVVMGKPEQQVCKASHCVIKQQ